MMGIAAYNRGTRLVSAQIDADKRPIEFEIMDNLNELPRGIGEIFCESVIRTIGGRFFLMNGREGGFSRFAFEYNSLRVLFSEWNIEVIGCGKDQHSFFYDVAPR